MDKYLKIDELRKKAEEIFKKKNQQLNIDAYKDDILKLVEDISIYQIELELQNQELQEKQFELEKEKKRFQDLYFNAPIGYILFDRKGVILELNTKAKDILGSSSTAYRKQPFSVFLKDENSNLFFSHIQEVFKNQQSAEIELEIIDKKEIIHYLKLKSNLFEEEYCRTLIEDITQQKEDNLKIKELNSRLETALNAGKMAWWEMDLPSGKVTSSPNKVLMLGRNLNDFNHYTDFTNIIHPEDYEDNMQAMRDHLEGKKDHYISTYRIKHIDGYYKWYQDIGKIIERNGENIKLTGIVTDITDHKEMQSLIENQNKDLSSLNVEKDKFLSIMAHDLRNPFNVILGFSNLILKEMSKEEYDKEKILNFLNIINSSAKNTYDLLENLLKWAMARQNKIEFNKTEVYLYTAVYEIISLLTPHAEIKGVKLINNVSPDFKCYCDEQMITTIIRNLVSNSIKYTNKGGSVTVSAEKINDKDLKMSIIDTGIGMSEKVQNSLFKIDKSISSPGTNGEQGTGIGLMICYEFIKKHGGEIFIESEQGKGTAFSFILTHS